MSTAITNVMSVKKKTVEDVDVRSKCVLIRLDLNVPLDVNQNIVDDRRIRAALPTVQKCLEGGGRLILMSHLGRPKGESNDLEKFSLAPVSKRFSELLDREVVQLDDCVGDDVSRHIAAMQDGDVCILQNLRFNKAETIKDKKAASDSSLRQQKDEFANQLSSLADIYVNDAFGTCHRDNASMLTVPQMMAGKPRVVGYLIQKELKFLGGAVAQPERPFVCLLGGAKVSDKLGVIHSLLEKCDTILIGGAMAYTFLAAEGVAVGKSLTEPDLFETARELRKEAGDALKLPVDSVVADTIAEGVSTQVCESSVFKSVIPADRMGLDIGPATIKLYSDIMASARTVVWNGPMGVFEIPPLDRGTFAMAKVVADATDRGAVTIIGGGDSAAAIDQVGLADRITHISTGGGASLEFLEGKSFAAINVLDDA